MSTSDQKLYTEFSFCLWLDGINSRSKSHLDHKSKRKSQKGKSHRDNKSKERFYNQRVFESRRRRKKTVDKDLLITYRFSDRKFSQPIIATSNLLQEQGIRNNFHKLFTNSWQILRE